MTTQNAQFQGQNIPTHINMLFIHRLTGSVTFLNTGTAEWENIANNPTNPYRLGSQNPQDNTTWGLNRVELNVPVSGGDPHTFYFDIDLDNDLTPPATPTPRVYNFQWRMLQEGVAWFGQSTTNVAITIVDPNV